MDPSDKELMEQLAKSPFGREGFDQRLRQRILDQAQQERSRSRMRSRFTWHLPMIALVSVSALFLAVWLWNNQQGQLPQDTLATPAVQPVVEQTAASVVATAEPLKKYALLLGLRQDKDTQPIPSSSYRTLLVADEDEPENLQLIADVPGLYVPHGQNFWRISTVESADRRHTLAAEQVTGNRRASSLPAAVPSYILSEKVSYAGNEFLSIQSTVLNELGETVNKWRVKHIGQLNVKPDDPKLEPHTLLREVMPDIEERHGDDPQWTIYRDPGRWVSELYESATGTAELVSGLPSNVIQHDTLLMNWPEIQKIEPNARDAFTYGNVLGVMTDKEVIVRSMNGTEPLPAAVHVPLLEGESLVMIQWAQNDKIDYVDKWIADFRDLQQQAVQE